MVAQSASGGVSVHFAASEDCAFQDSWVDFPQGAAPAVTETERGRLAQESNGIVPAICQYIDRSPAKFFLTLNTPEGGTSRTVSLAPELSRDVELHHALRVTVGNSEARASEEQLCEFSVIEMAENPEFGLGQGDLPKARPGRSNGKLSRRRRVLLLRRLSSTRLIMPQRK